MAERKGHWHFVVAFGAIAIHVFHQMARIDARRGVLGRVNVQPVPGEIVTARIRLFADADGAQPTGLGVELVLAINRQIEKRHLRAGHHGLVNRRFRRAEFVTGLVVRRLRRENSCARS